MKKYFTILISTLTKTIFIIYVYLYVVSTDTILYTDEVCYAEIILLI